MALGSIVLGHLCLVPLVYLVADIREGRTLKRYLKTIQWHAQDSSVLIERL
jgi:hypothetical protein